MADGGDGIVESIGVLVVLTSDARRGAEIEGHRLAREISGGDVNADVVALTPSGSSASLAVPTLGASALGSSTLRALRQRARRADVVIAYGSRTLPACAIATLGTRTSFVYRSIGDPSAWVHSGWRRHRTRWLMRRAAAVVALWPGGEQAIRTLYGVDRTTSISNARSTQDFHPAGAQGRTAARDHLSVASDDVVILWVGALVAEKRLDVAIEAVSSLPDDHVLVVVGDGSQRTELEDRATDQLGDRCRFVGALSDVTSAYAAADLVLSTSSTEGMPGVLIEAGFSGLPVVATDVGAVPWLFERGLRGEMCSVDDSADGIARLILDALNGVSDGDTGTARLIDVCGWDVVTTQWRNVIEENARDW